jgi:hypothetical protein
LQTVCRPWPSEDQRGISFVCTASFLFLCTRPASHHFRSLFPSVSVSPAESLRNAAALSALEAHPTSPAAEDDS